MLDIEQVNSAVETFDAFFQDILSAWTYKKLLFGHKSVFTFVIDQNVSKLTRFPNLEGFLFSMGRSTGFPSEGWA